MAEISKGGRLTDKFIIISGRPTGEISTIEEAEELAKKHAASNQGQVVTIAKVLRRVRAEVAIYEVKDDRHGG